MKREKAGEGRGAEAAATVGRVDESHIARRAYEIYLDRGAEPGRELDDWFRAQAELLTAQH